MASKKENNEIETKQQSAPLRIVSSKKINFQFDTT